MANIPGIFPKFLPNLTYTDPNITYLIIQGENDPYPGKIPISALNGSGNGGINGTTWQLTVSEDPNGVLMAQRAGDLALTTIGNYVWQATANGDMNWANQGFSIRGKDAPLFLAGGGPAATILGQLWLDGTTDPGIVKETLFDGVFFFWLSTGVNLTGPQGINGTANLSWSNLSVFVGTDLRLGDDPPPSGGNVANYPSLFLDPETGLVFNGEQDPSFPERTGNYTKIGRILADPFSVPGLDSGADYITQCLVTDTAGQFWIANTSPGVGVTSPLASDTNFNRVAVVSQFTGKIDPPVVIEAGDITLDPDIGGYTSLRDLLQYLYDNI